MKGINGLVDCFANRCGACTAALDAFLGVFALAGALSTEQFGSNYGKHILAGCQLPVVLIASIIGAWITFRQKKLQLANILTSIPVVYVIPGLIAWLLNF